MKRTMYSGSFLLVEGVTDSRLYGKFADRYECDMIPAHSKENVKMTVKEMTVRRNDKKVIGIIDSDTDRLKGISYSQPLFATDCRDSEAMMLSSPAFENIIVEYGDRDKVASFESKYGNIRDAVLLACYPLGLLMFISERNDDSLCFKDLDHTLFIEKKGLKLNENAMIGAILDNSPHFTGDLKTITAMLKKETGNDHDPWDVCRGHDMTAVLAFGLRDVFGSYNCRHIRTGELSGALRLAYDKETFHATKLFKDVSAWSTGAKTKVWS